ncbi:MAG: oligosaccharide flippase family protein [Acetobacteraceae bacterium]|nr:oligosaccharide flippase family protein [Acetobacteraceae bacterium]
MIAMRLAFRGIGLASTLILVRFLSPADFGLVGFVTIAYSVLDQLSDLSSGVALIRMKTPERSHYDTAWTLGVLRGLLTGVLFALAAPLLAAFIQEPRVEPISYVIALLAVIQGFENIGMADLQRELHFNRVFWCGFASKVVGFCSCVPAAFILRSYWALVIGFAGTRLASVVLSYLVSSYRPRFGLKAWRDLLTFSKWMVLVNIQKLIDSYSMVFVVGRMGGPSAIGNYQVAYQIGALPPTEIAAPARQPLYAGYSRAGGDTDRLRLQFLEGLSLMLCLVMPASVGIVLLAKSMTFIFLGKQWLDVAPVVGLCALYALFDSIAHFCEPVFFALHRERSYVHTFTIVLAVRMPGILIGTYLCGLEGAVLSLVASAFFNLLLWLRALRPLIGVTSRNVLGSIWRTMLATCGMMCAVWWTAERWPFSYEIVGAGFRFTSLSLIGGAVQFVGQYSLWLASAKPAGPEATLLNLVVGALRRAHRLLGRARSAFA